MSVEPVSLAAGLSAAALYSGFIRSRLQAKRSPATLAWYEQMLAPLAALVGEAELTTEHVEDWLMVATSAATARARLRAVRAMCNWAQRRHRVPSAAAAVIPPKASNRLPRVFTQGELRRIFEVAQLDARDYAAVSVLLDTGVRIGELTSVRTERIERETLADGSTTLALTVTGKVGDRRVPLSSSAYQAVMRIAPPAGAVFRSWPGRVLAPGRETRPMTVATLKDRIRRVVERAGVTGDKLGPHTFRHTFATMYLRAGGDIYRLQRILGHTSIKQTQVYLHLADPEAFEEHSRLSPLRQLMEVG
jgi:integrase/recombinase XerD